MTTAARALRSQTRRTRCRVYLAFEFKKDAHRRTTFLSQANAYCDFRIEDLSLSSAVHDSRWQREALKRIQSADVVIVLLGPDTYNAPGVLDELSLAGQVSRPVVQLKAQRRQYGLVSHHIPVCSYKWKRINEMMRDPEAFAAVSGSFGR